MDGMKVVVVSDRAGGFSAVVQSLMSRFASLSVVEVEGAEEGMRAVAAEAPDLALVAAGMEGVDGVEFCRRVRARAAGACCPIVLADLDGTSAGRAGEAQQAGAADFISGPAERAGVAGRIAALLRVAAPAGLCRRENAHLRAQLRQAQRMEAIGRLGCGITHDFCNQLTAIRSCCRLALDDPRSSARTRAVVKEIDEAAERSETLGRYLLALGRARPLGRSLVDVNAVLAEMAGPLKRLLGEHVELVLATEVGLEAVEVDRPLLEQALLNLAVNARDAMPRGGALRMETANIPAGPAGDAARVQVAVSDTGAGMDAETAARAFDPFFTTKSPDEGTGLGLAMVQAFMRQSGGQVAVESKPGLGSTFRLIFPAAVAPVAEEAPPACQAWTGHETILLVEDDDAVRRVLARAMTAAGYQVLAAADAAEALDLSAEAGRPIDLVMTDVVLPGLDGHGLAARLAESRPGLPVLYLSGYPPDTAKRYGAGPPGELLRKPFSVESLLAAVRRALDNPHRPGA